MSMKYSGKETQESCDIEFTDVSGLYWGGIDRSGWYYYNNDIGNNVSCSAVLNCTL